MNNKKILLLLSVFTLFLISCGADQSPVRINEVLSHNLNLQTDDLYYNYADWIELYNEGNETIDLSGYVLSDKNDPNRWKIPIGTKINSRKFQLFWADGKNNRNHTSFKLKNKGETVFLFNKEGVLIDSLQLKKQFPDVSFGYSAENKLSYFTQPTPQKVNSNPIDTANFSKVRKPKILTPNKNPHKGMKVELFASDISTIRYTLDCTAPTINSLTYSQPISIDSTTIIRAKCFLPNGVFSKTATKSYIIQKNTDLPIISLVTDPKNLWDDQIGIYTEGKNGIKGQIGPIANWNQNWERPANFEFFEKKDTINLNLMVGIKVLGLYISAWPQKPFGIYFRKNYGKSSVKYPFFKERTYEEHENLVIRVADWHDTGIRDGMMTNIVTAGKMNVDYQAYRPVAAYLNGKFWGIYNLREKQNESYLKNIHGVDPDKVDLLEYKIGQLNVIEGSGDAYKAMLDFCANNSLTSPENYQKISSQMDMDNYLDYTIAELYFANTDWPGNNLKVWKSQEPNSKWRWILYDLDNGFDFYHGNYSQFNALNHALTDKGDAQHNPPNSTLLFRSLMANQTFTQLFLQRFAVLLNTSLSVKNTVAIIDSIANNVKQLIPEHAKRWENVPVLPGGYRFYKTYPQWNKNIDFLKAFAEQRTPFLWKMLKGTFQINETVVFSLKKNNGGYCTIAGVSIQKNYNGKQFKGVPMIIKAIPNDGYKFVGWKGDNRKEQNIQIVLNQNSSLEPVFEENDY